MREMSGIMNSQERH